MKSLIGSSPEFALKISSDCVFARRESNVRSYCRSHPVVFNKAEGALIWDEKGNRYIDFFSGAGALNYGHNDIGFRESLIEYIQDANISHGLDFHTKAKRDFLKGFEKTILIPRNLPHKVMFAGPTGTNAVEAAMKIARLSTKRTRIATFTNAFHGMTLGALAATGSAYSRAGAGISLNGIDRYPFDGYFGPAIDTLSMIEKLLQDPSSGYQPPAAFLLETIQAEGGINVASRDWLEGLSRLAKKIGSLLIVDDIQVGCGRTGSFFSFDDTNLSPDIICLSKSISGYGLPMSLVLISPEHDVMSPGQHNGTFRGNNMAFVTALQTMRFWECPEFNRLVECNVRVLGSMLGGIRVACGSGFSVRGKGMIQGLACPTPAIANSISRDAFERGLVIETCGPHGEVVKLLPALNIPTDILQEGLEILRQSATSFSDDWGLATA